MSDTSTNPGRQGMHYNNRLWLAELKATHPDWFTGGRVLELGSGGADPVIRELFNNPEEYVGVDIVEGPNVDVVADAATVDFGNTRFDTVMCFSLLEHAPNWRDCLTNAVDLMKQGSVMVGCHGAEGNQHHGPEPWAIVTEQDFLDHVRTLDVDIEESFFEEARYGPDCTGAYDWILWKR
jgi:SAM-dependent methyltransferase